MSNEHEFTEHLNAEAAKQRQEEEQRAKLAAEAERVNRETRRARRRREITKRTLLKALGAAGLCLGLWLAMGFDLVAFELAIPVMAAALAWLTFWAGAWAQYMWEGALYGGTE